MPRSSTPPPPWPPKRPVLGVDVSATTFDEAVEVAIAAAQEGASGVVASVPVRAVVTASRDPARREQVNRFDLVAPGERSLRWALRVLHGARAVDRFGGPELALRLCERAAAEDVAIYLYGGTPEIVGRFRANLRSRFPQLRVAGCEAPPARGLKPRDDRALVGRIHRSGAGLVFLGLGAARDVEFAAAHRDRIHAVQICASAAFDVYAERAPAGPRWGGGILAGGLFLAGVTRDLLRPRREFTPRRPAPTPGASGRRSPRSRAPRTSCR